MLYYQNCVVAVSTWHDMQLDGHTHRHSLLMIPEALITVDASGLHLLPPLPHVAHLCQCRSKSLWYAQCPKCVCVQSHWMVIGGLLDKHMVQRAPLLH